MNYAAIISVSGACIGLVLYKTRHSIHTIVNVVGELVNRNVVSKLRNSNVEKKGKNKYILNYTIGKNEYKILLKKKLIPSSISCVWDRNGKDVTYEVKQFMGPNEDFYGANVTPTDMGFEYLLFETKDDEQFSFGAFSIIDI